jgi:hypothetical protein
MPYEIPYAKDAIPQWCYRSCSSRWKTARSSQLLTCIVFRLIVLEIRPNGKSVRKKTGQHAGWLMADALHAFTLAWCNHRLSVLLPASPEQAMSAGKVPEAGALIPPPAHADLADARLLRSQPPGPAGSDDALDNDREMGRARNVAKMLRNELPRIHGRGPRQDVRVLV